MKNNANLLTLVQDALARDLKLNKCLNGIRDLVYSKVTIAEGTANDPTANESSPAVAANATPNDLKDRQIRPSRLSVHIDWAKGNIALVGAGN